MEIFGHTVESPQFGFLNNGASVGKHAENIPTEISINDQIPLKTTFPWEISTSQ